MAFLIIFIHEMHAMRLLLVSWMPETGSRAMRSMVSNVNCPSLLIKAQQRAFVHVNRRVRNRTRFEFQHYGLTCTVSFLRCCHVDVQHVAVHYDIK